MRYLVLSDIHANLEGLRALLQAARGWDGVLFLGDLVGYGPNPNECAELLRQQGKVSAVIGNHDVAALGQMDLEEFNPQAKFAAMWTQNVMSEETRAYLESLPQVEELDAITLVHGSPRDPVWEYLDQPAQAPENFARFTTPLCFVGHTHVPRVFSQDPDTKETAVHVPASEAVFGTSDGIRRIINPGSAGQPRDGDPRAAFGIFDSDAQRFQYHRVPYDIATTQKKMQAAGLPKSLAERLEFGF